MWRGKLFFVFIVFFCFSGSIICCVRLTADIKQSVRFASQTATVPVSRESVIQNNIVVAFAAAATHLWLLHIMDDVLLPLVGWMDVSWC